MLLSLLTTCLLAHASACLRQQDEPAPAPSPELVKETCAALEKALAPEADAEQRKQVVRKALECVHPDVIAVLDTKGLGSKAPEVRGVAVEALGRMPHVDALKALTRALKRDKKELKESPPEYAALLKNIARHGSEESIPLLVEDAFESPDAGVITARLLGLGHIRSKASVEELIRLMRSTRGAREGYHKDEFRLALVVLTGEDKGTDQSLWINWYGDNDKKLEIKPEAGPMAPELEKRWASYWGELPKDKKKRPGRKERDQ